MGNSLTEIATRLKESDKKVQLIYAFNGVGKTRLSSAFKDLVAPKHDEEIAEEYNETKAKIIYYNAFTEDLFSWDNDLDNDTDRKLLIRTNSFTDWVLKDQGQGNKIITHFQHYTNNNLNTINKLTPNFNREFNEITFSIAGGNDSKIDNIKISKGEESCLIWCFFFSLLEQVVETLNIEEKSERDTDQFNDLEYVFIDDPVSSLDENHLIELAVNIAELIKSCNSNLKFIITTHNPLFYNVLYSELGGRKSYLLKKNEDETFELEEKDGGSNKSFSYHLFLKQTLESAIKNGNIQRYHFTLLRNLYEKTANFLGYDKWSDLLPNETEGAKKNYLTRIMNFASHSALSNEEVAEPTEPEKMIVKHLLDNLVNNYGYKKEK